ncbi:OsmC family protein [Noviherbaspirillum denitrificans]|uniref:Osmotically inducible protein OsmC n=1 Tax=Noviherbaspirillum denitrificans TaxID=1968433 RepID=A0A254TD51_9BURK|nr:OsmC family protein [Noviherbaspirillum denitrificans]OWW20475.1 osmotically inducible protein OsmC [Noviherbaspirillum denitrificans]
MKRTATAAWSGGLKDGTGTVSLQSGVLSNSRYGFQSRFEDGPGTNPEELIAAAHAGCFTMALSLQLEEAGYKAESLKTDAVVTLEKLASGFEITKVHLNLVAKVPGIGKDVFDKAVDGAKVGCPVSKLLKAEISLTSKLE